MKRVILSVTATVLGLVALLSYKTQSPLASSSANLPSAGLGGSTATSSTSTAPTTGAPPDPSTKSGESSSAAAAPTTASYLGSAVQTRYGIVQVKITVNGKQITNVSFAQLTAFDGRSQQINSHAAPVLLQETLSAQSAHINAVSGASYTSAGYEQSLQSALDKAGI